MKKIIILFLLVFSMIYWNRIYSQNNQPNIVIILIDDLGYGDIGTYGATGFETPNIDLLASRGMKFTNYYAAQPVCSASRAGLCCTPFLNKLFN